MNVRATRQEHRRTIRLVLCVGAAACALAVLPHDLFAQSEHANSQMPMPNLAPAQPMVPPTTVEEADAMTATLYPDGRDEADEMPANAEGDPSRPWKLTLHGSASVIYDSNIFIAPAHRQADLLSTLSPGLRFALGDWLAQQENFLVFDYTLNGLIFASHPSQDTIEQQAELDAQWRRAQFTFGLQFRFQGLSSPNVDVGNRTRRRLYETASLNKYELSAKTYLEANLYNNVDDYETELSSTEWIGRFWYNYRSTPKLTFGAGASVGHLAVESSPGQTFEQLLVRASYTATEKLSFEAYGGVEIRQLETGERVFPVLNVTGSYRPFEATEVQLSAYRKVQNSALLAGENYTITGFTAEASRNFRTGCDFIFTGGYNHSDYSAASQGEASSREDSYYFIRPSLRFEVTRRIHAEIFYLFQKNDSTYAPTAFHDTQVGALVRFDY